MRRKEPQAAGGGRAERIPQAGYGGAPQGSPGPCRGQAPQSDMETQARTSVSQTSKRLQGVKGSWLNADGPTAAGTSSVPAQG